MSPRAEERGGVRAAFSCSDPAQGRPDAMSPLGFAAESVAAGQPRVLPFVKTLL